MCGSFRFLYRHHYVILYAAGVEIFTICPTSAAQGEFLFRI